MVTTNVWPPDDIAGVRNVIWESVTVRSVTCWLPRVTVAATLFEPRKLAPVTVTRVPPVFGPRFGVEDATSGVRTGGPYVKPAVTVADALPDDGVTLRSTSPSAAPAGTVAVISVELLRTTSVAARGAEGDRRSSGLTESGTGDGDRDAAFDQGGVRRERCDRRGHVGGTRWTG